MQRSYSPQRPNGASGPSGSSATPNIESAETRAALAALSASYGLVGQVPPEPPTWRGRIGGRLVKAVQRLLFWYTPQIVNFQYSALRAIEELAKSIQKQHHERLAVLARMDALERQLEGLRLQVVPRVERRMAMLMEEIRNVHPGSLMEEEADLDRLYADFTDVFRGSRQEIKERLAVYVPRLTKAGIGGASMPVLDIACGRGEWLELLREHGLAASGVDNSHAMVVACRALGLEVTEADAVEHLRSLPEASLGAVTGFHIIEHLPLSRLLSLLDAAVRALKPGGVAIFETPNPNNIVVGSRNFYLDPTHHHPIPPQLARFLAGARGLRRLEILELHPCPEASLMDVATEGEVAARINESFYGPQDYAVIGWKA